MKRTILIADDSVTTRFTLARLLRDKLGDCDVEEAVDGSQALQCLNSRHYDLMILDLGMPVLSGYEVLKRLPEGFAQATPIVVLTGRERSDDIAWCYEKGATYYFSKPVELNGFLGAIAGLLQN